FAFPLLLDPFASLQHQREERVNLLGVGLGQLLERQQERVRVVGLPESIDNSPHSHENERFGALLDRHRLTLESLAKGVESLDAVEAIAADVETWHDLLLVAAGPPNRQVQTRPT